MRQRDWASLAAAVGLALFVCAGAEASQTAAAPAPQTAAPQPGFVGMDMCVQCHEETVNKFKHTPHMSSPQGCEGCHGPGQAHVENAGDKTKIRVFKDLSNVESSGTCMECHNKGNQKHWTGSMHDSRQVACVNCHEIHPEGPVEKALLQQPQMKLCTGCHLQKKAQLLRPGHMPMREGKMECTSCHNPHGTPNERLLLQTSVNQNCYTCHAEKRGPFLWEHAPVRENCALCHDPHGSNHDKLLVAKQPFLCQRCHLNTRHPGTLYDETNTSTGRVTGGTGITTVSNRAVEHACKNCHQNVHGGNAPSGPYLGG
jgi:DmsE family decaheme c-type cytochrome